MVPVPMPILPLAEIGKVLGSTHVGLIVIEVVCSQSTFEGVNDIETDAELEATLSENV